MKTCVLTVNQSFTQLDIETSFMHEDDIQALMEGMIRKMFKDVIGIELPAFSAFKLC